MIRFLATLIVGLLLGILCDRNIPALLPRTPAMVQNAAASVGVKPKPAVVAPATYTPVAPMSASVQAESNRNYDEAIKQVIAYQQSGGDAFTTAERAGWLCYLKGAYAEAEKAYLTANQMHTTALNPLLGLLNVAQAMKDETRIRKAAEAVLKIDPANYRASMALGGRSFGARDYRGAAFTYRRVLQTYPDDVDARSGLAWAEYYTGDTHEAFVQFQTILNTYPDYPYARQGYKLLAGVNGVVAK